MVHEGYHMCRIALTTLCCLLLAALLLASPAHAAKKAVAPVITPSELQSQIMSFADRFIARVSGATLEFAYMKEHTALPLVRLAAHNRKLEACTAAVNIAAGTNPEVALLDMVVLVSLLRLTTEDVWFPEMKKRNVAGGEILLNAYVELEKDIWSIAHKVLSEEQSRELQQMIRGWHKKNVGKPVAITSIRFSNFASKRRQSTLVKGGKPKGFLKAVAETSREIEHARVLAERTVFLIERQPTLIRWQMEQIFFDLAMEPEFATVISTASNIGQVAKQLSRSIEKLPVTISAERKAAIEQAFRELSRERSETISQAISEISRERQALINQTSERILEKAFYMGLALILVLLLGAIVARLIYRYLEIRLFERKPSRPPVSVSKA